MRKNVFFVLGCALFTFSASAAAVRSDLKKINGLKFPNSAMEGRAPVGASAWALDLPLGQQAPGFSELLPYALLAPDQEEAGSCLYMTMTGIAEWWLARNNPQLSRAPDGPIDLSERFTMNLAGQDEETPGLEEWKTDSIYLLNRAKTALRNRDYRFTKGWYRTNAAGDYVPAKPTDRGAEYDAGYNWIDEMKKVSHAAERVRLPIFEREVLFADPEDNQWNVGVMPDGIVEKIKQRLQERKAPVYVIYNHFGYWHAAIILGYDDEASTKNCSFVREFIDYMRKRPEELRAEAAKETDPAEKRRLLAAARRAEQAYQDIQQPFQRGGCQAKGMFYVRDSIYGDASEPVYDYDLSRKGDEAPYSKRIVMHEYEWVKYMANHAVQIYIR